MNRSIDLSHVREQLVAQLVLLGDEKKRFLDNYYMMPGKERVAMSDFLTLYTETLRKLLSTAHTQEQHLPDTAADEELRTVVLIGSHVTIKYPDYDTQDSFTIVLPEHADADENLISFLSPVGSQLLLARVGEMISADTPSGAYRVLITETYLSTGSTSVIGAMASGKRN